MKPTTATVVLFFLLWPVASAAGLSAPQVLEKADRARGNVPGLIWTVRMTSMEGSDQREEMVEVKARNEDVLATFVAPPRVKGQMLLMAGRNMWFIKPGVSKPVPISPRQKLMGQAANGDIASTNYSGDYEGIFKEEEAMDGEPCYVLDLTARSKNVTYDRIVYWVSKKRLVGVKSNFHTVSGKKFKSATFQYGNTLTYRGEQIPFVSKMVIQDAIRPQEITTLEYSNIVVGTIPDETFNLNLLMR